MAQAAFNQFIRQRNQRFIAADNFLREENLSTFLQYTLSKNMEEQLKLVQKVIEKVGGPNRRICQTLLRYNVVNRETSYAQVRLFGRKKDYERFQQTVVCVILVFWKELNKCFLKFFLKSLFFAMLGILPTPLFL